MNFLIKLWLITLGISLIGCGTFVQPSNTGDSPPKTSTVPVVEKIRVVQATSVSMVVTVVPETSIPTSPKLPPTPIWINDNLILVDISTKPPSKAIELQVGQQIGVMPLPNHLFDWEVTYNANILELVTDINQTQAPQASWIWTAKKEGKTTLRFSSGPPPCTEENKHCIQLPIISKQLTISIIP